MTEQFLRHLQHKILLSQLFSHLMFTFDTTPCLSQHTVFTTKTKQMTDSAIKYIKAFSGSVNTLSY